MSRLKAFVLFWYDFIVGDDWVIAVGVIASLVATWQLLRRGIDAWWLVPITVAILLYASLLRAARRSHR